MSAQQPYTGRSVFDSLSTPGSATPPASAPVPPAEPGVTLLYRSGRERFVAMTEANARLLLEDYRLSGALASRRLIGASLVVDFSEVCEVEVVEDRAKRAPSTDAAAVAKIAEEAKAAAEVAKAAAADANAAADDAVAASGDSDVADWTDEQIRDALDSMRHKVATNHYVDGETAMDVNLEIMRLSGVLVNRQQARAASAPAGGFSVNVPPPPGAAN